MVSKEPLAYLFIGQSSPGKDAQIRALKEKLLSKEAAQFNYDVVYAKDLSLKELQEKLLFLPLNSQKRVLFLRQAQHLKPEAKSFILKYLRNPKPGSLLLFDFDEGAEEDDFLASLKKQAQASYFTGEKPSQPFDLVRQVERGDASRALKVLGCLFAQGVRPEFILGALRFIEEQPASAQAGKTSALLLACDLEIKTGRLKSSFALEKLVVKLCAFRRFFKA